MYTTKFLTLLTVLNFFTMAAVSSSTSKDKPGPVERSLRQTLLDTVNGYISGFNNPGPDLSGVVALRTPDCNQRILPANLGAPPFTNEGYVAYSRRLRTIITNFEVRISPSGENEAPIVVDEQARIVVLSLASTGDTPLGPYANEYCITLAMTSDGKMIREVTEFIDSRATAEFLERVGTLTLLSG